MKKIIIRREFLQLSGVNALAAIIASCAPPSTETPTPQPTDEVDPTQTPSQPPTETPPPTEVPPPPIYRVEQTNLSDDAEVMAALTPQLSEVLAIASDMGRKDLKAWEDLSADSFSAKLLKVTKPDGSDESSIFLVQNNQETKPRVYAVHNADGSVQRAMTQLMQTDSENGIEIGYINGIDPDSSPTIRPLFRIKEDTVYFIDSQNQERETNLAPEQVLDPCVDCREYENIALKDGYIHGQKKGAKVEYQLKDASWQEVKKHDYPTRWDDETIIQEINKKIDDLDIASSLRKEKSVLSGGEANANIDNATTTHLLQFNGIVADVRILNFGNPEEGNKVAIIYVAYSNTKNCERKDISIMPIVVGVEMGGKLGTPQIKSDESSERFKRIDDPATFEELIDLQRNRINKYGNKNYLLVMGNLQQISEVPFKGWSFYLEDRRNNPNAHVWGNFMTSYADKDSYISYANMNFKKSTEGYLMNGGNGDIRAKLTDQISNPNTSSKLGLIAAPEYWLE